MNTSMKIKIASFIIGVIFCFVGLYLLLSEEPNASELENHVIFMDICCNVPNQVLYVGETVNMGSSEIFFVYNKDDSIETEYVDFWVKIYSAKFPYNWKIEYSAEEMNLKNDNDNNYSALMSNRKLGSGNNTYFRLRFEKENSNGSKILLRFNDNDIFQRYGDKFALLMPHITQWVNNTNDIDEKTSFDSEKQSNMLINGETMFLPHLKISAGLQNPSYTNSGIILESISPKYNISGYYITWFADDYFMPLVLFNDIKAQNAMTNNETKASFYISLGISLIILFPEIFKKRIKNERKNS